MQERMPPTAAALLAFVLCLGGCPAQAAADASSVTPVQKVIQMLQGMEASAQKSKSGEEVSYASYKQFCIDKAASTQKEIDAGNLLIEELTAQRDKLESDIANLVQKLEALNQDVTQFESDIKGEKEKRERDHAANTAHIDDLGESVDALDRAVQTLSQQDVDRKQAGDALLQLTTMDTVPEDVQRTVVAFLGMQTGDDFLTREAPEANGYEFQSGGILELLKNLHADFKKQKSTAEKENMNQNHASFMMMQDLTDQVEGAKNDIAVKTQDKETKSQMLAETKKQLTSATADRDQNVAYLDDLKIECDEKSRSFEEKQKLRGEEINTLNKAIEIISSKDVSGAADAHLPNLLQKRAVGHGQALAQLRSTAGAQPSEVESSVRNALIIFLDRESHRLQSSGLGLLAQRFASSNDPFVKVKKLIFDMMQKLLKEAASEAEQKGFCDTELGQNKITRTKLQNTIDSLTAKTDEAKVMIMETKDRLAKLASEINDLNTAMGEASTLRGAEHEKNTQTIQDATAAQEAVQAATSLLKDFYEKAAQSTALVQVRSERQRPTDFAWQSGKIRMGTPEWEALADPSAKLDKGHREGMQTFGETETGQQDQAGGVFAMLEVILSDFQSLEAETTEAESTALAAHTQFETVSKRSVAVKDKESQMLNTDLAQAEAQLSTDIQDMKNSQDQLLAANRVYDNLKPVCVDTGLTHEKRMQMRQAEIQSLEEALQILSGATFAT